MSELFCLHCEPTGSGEHQKECLLYTPGEEEIVINFVDEISDLVGRFATLTGMDEEAVREMFGTDAEKLKRFVGEKKK